MTATGAVMGTPYYMSPEQAKGSKEIDTRSDLYAVGVILFRCVTGQVPFTGENFNEVLFNVVLSQATNPRELAPALEPGFENIIVRAMARDPAHRFQSAAEFIAVLDAWSTDGAVVSLPPPQRTSVGAVSQPIPSQTLSSASDIELGPPSSTEPGATGGPGGVTSSEWTQSGFSTPRSSQGVLVRVAALTLLGAGALAAGYVWLGADAPTSAATATPLVSAVQDRVLELAAGTGADSDSSGAADPSGSVAPEAATSPSASASVEPESRPAVRPRKRPARSALADAPPAPPRAEPPAVEVPVAAPPPPPPPSGPRPGKKKKDERSSQDDPDFGY
jgi:serine/threonine-protein kinase